MKKDDFKTNVIFLIHPGNENFEDPDLFAFFFDDKWSELPQFKDTYTCYAHIGQHSACHIDYVKECRKATKKEYIDLFNELESIGYNLETKDFELPF